MKTWRAIIIDDEPLARQELKRLLSNYDFINIIDDAGSVSEAKDKINYHNPDLIFLDIDLGSQSGFNLLEYFELSFHVIFVTAYDEYALRAFEVNALDYLQKPVHPERLKESLKRLGSQYNEEPNTQLRPFDKLLLRQHKSSKFISVDSITYIEAQGDYTRVCIKENVKGIMHNTMKKWVELLPEKIFYQLHRSYIVNINHIEELVKGANNKYEAHLKFCNKTVPISKNYSKIIKNHFLLK